MLALAPAVARVPDGLDAVESAPLLCAGITTFNALRNCGARPGDLVAVHGVGGLGHLGIQFAARSGFRTVAINRGRDKEALARSLGAQDYIDSEAADPAAALQAMGGAKAIIATVTSADAMQAVAGGVGVNGTLMVIGAARRPHRQFVRSARQARRGEGLVFGDCFRLGRHPRVQSPQQHRVDESKSSRSNRRRPPTTG
jgi:D-arabinose 1-dehydrogenase-like Zn-dependent alcohol dehydrogenase